MRSPRTSRQRYNRTVAENGGKILAGFFLSGFLLALEGVVLPAWGYHRDPPAFAEVGHFFLALAAGVIASPRLARPLLRRRGLSFLLVFACSLSCVALAYLALVGPPWSGWWRVAGMLVLGVGAGLLSFALFNAVSPDYQADLTGTIVKGGIYFGFGCLAVTLLVAATLYTYTVASILVFMAAVPGLFAVMYSKLRMQGAPEGAHPTLSQAFRDFRSPGAVLFALLLFFQFGNEWAIAGWLPLFLIRRVGLSPKTALTILAFYWVCLLVGRLGAIAVLPRVRHGRVLMGSALSSLFGLIVLFFTDNTFGACTGAFFVGSGYAVIYPLVSERIGSRFPYYHPGAFNGIFSFATLGGLLAPATLGYAAAWQGVGVAMAVPLLGTCVVVLLLSLIWLEMKVTGR